MAIWNVTRKQRRPKSSRIDSLVGRATTVSGDLTFVGGLHVDGIIRGNVRAEGDEAMLTLSDKGTIDGEVRAPYIVLNGTVRGDVWSTGHVELGVNARVTGDVRYRLIEMAMGAEVNGRLIRLPEEGAVESVRTRPAATPALDGPGTKGQTGAQ
jgi:cytoskeletal protein CcmA (bactofilin family)